MRVSLHPGVWIGSLGILLTGGLSVTTAEASQTHALWIGYAAIGFGILLVIWGFKWDGKHWWASIPSKFRALRASRNTIRSLYVGRIVISDGLVAAQNTLQLTAFVYNATGRARWRIGVVKG